MTTAQQYNVNEKGYYGQFGGAFIPEMLYPTVEELKNNYLSIINDPAFTFKNFYARRAKRLSSGPTFLLVFLHFIDLRT